jgi:hypothetical protein
MNKPMNLLGRFVRSDFVPVSFLLGMTAYIFAYTFSWKRKYSSDTFTGLIIPLVARGFNPLVV